MAFIAKLQGLREHSQLGAGTILAIANFRDAVVSLSSNQSAAPDMSEKLKPLQNEIETATAAINWTQTTESPMHKLVNAAFTGFTGCLRTAAGTAQAKVTPTSAFNVKAVTISSTGDDDLSVDAPLVHPSQCQLVLRKADAAFFARDMETASRSYTLLRERFSFVPSLIKNGAGTRLLAAFEHLEHEGLSWWTLDILQLMYREVCARLAQIELGNDLFGLEKDWVPRLSYSYYSGYARQQLQRLKVYEISYWAF